MDQPATLSQLIWMLTIFTFANAVVPFIKKWATDRAALATAANLREQQGNVDHKFAAKLEEIKKQNNQLLEHVKNQNSLRLAAAEKRLEVYAKTSEHLYAIHKDFFNSRILELPKNLESHFKSNGIYFNKETLVALEEALIAIDVRNKKIQYLSASVVPEGIQKLMSDMRGKIITAHNLLFESVNLPPLKHEENSSHNSTEFIS
ncbi:hypothetical protein QT397_18130 [Microbulbifer sp. MKSA007]|nr:hypothetical protein QT397_18130 [Microbulbifer sp. MKSA007]